MKRIPVTPSLDLIVLDQRIDGFQSFIGSWLYKGDRNILVDTGPAATVSLLLRTLKDMGITHLDAILITHIHIDHAGGVGDLVDEFPGVPVVLHESGMRHMANPDRLWEGSLKTLGDTARAYGPIRPVPLELLRNASQFTEFEIQPIPTPGHAAHHVSYRIGSVLFVGEAGGVYAELKTKNGKQFYLRPATPPRFFLETSTRSIDALLETPHDLICYGHFGYSDRTPELLATHKQQLLDWENIIQRQLSNDPEAGLEDRCIDELLKSDPLLAAFHNMEPPIRKRERGFLRNSVRGFLGYLAEKEDAGK